MTSLLGGQLSPIASTIGFIEAECQEVVRVFSEWQGSLGISWKKKVVKSDSLEAALRTLLPLTSVMSVRELFVPTASPWTAYFANCAHGTDAQSRMSFLAERIGCRGLRVVNVPNTIGKGGSYGATILEMYGPKREGQILNYVRSIAAANDGGRWVFEIDGTPQAFEEPEKYKARLVRDRFTPEMLERYLRALQVDAFSEKFYRHAEALLLNIESPIPSSVEVLSIEEARARYGG